MVDPSLFADALPGYNELEISCLNSDFETCLLGVEPWVLLTAALGVSLFVGAGLSAILIKLVLKESKIVTHFMIVCAAGTFILPLSVYLMSQILTVTESNVLIDLFMEILIITGLIVVPSLVLTYLISQRMRTRSRFWSTAIMLKRVLMIYLGLGLLLTLTFIVSLVFL